MSIYGKDPVHADIRAIQIVGVGWMIDPMLLLIAVVLWLLIACVIPHMID